MDFHGLCDHCGEDHKVYLFWVDSNILPLCQPCANSALNTPVVKSYDF